MPRVKEAIWEGFALVNTATGLAARLDDGANVVLTFHSVGAPGRFGNVPVDQFRRVLNALKRRYEIVDLPAVLDSSDAKQVAITFDDGRENVYEYARPVLRDLEVPATLFLIEGRIGDDDFVTAGQAAELAADDLITLGNHTRTHPDLSSLDGDDLHKEIAGAQDRLESRLGIPIGRFAYPRGDFSRAAVNIVRDTHDLAVCTEPRVVSPDVDRYLIPRIKGHLSERRLLWEVTSTASWIRKLASKAGMVTR